MENGLTNMCSNGERGGLCLNPTYASFRFGRRLASTVGVEEDARARLERRVQLRAWSHSIRVAVFASNAIGAAKRREPRAMDER